MSYVTTYVLLIDGDYDCPEDNSEPSYLVAELNTKLAAEHIGSFKKLDHLFGGNKYPQIDAYGLAMNYRTPDQIIPFIRSVEWPEDCVVQLVINSEHDHGVQCLTLVGKPEVDTVNVEATT